MAEMAEWLRIVYAHYFNAQAGDYGTTDEAFAVPCNVLARST